jgi:misacylated tRNA(Ala) deacylase
VTELAYLADIGQGYVREFRARIVALPPGAVVLDRTYFYPSGGGQPCDRGLLELPEGDRLEVVDVTKSGPSVVHRVRIPRGGRRPTVGLEVAGTIDWERRYRHMRLHTAQHLLSARIYARVGRRTRRANLSGVVAVLELEGEVLPATLEECLDDLRAAVADPKPVTIRHVPRAEWDRNPQSQRSGLVALPTQVDPVRVVEIEGLDVCPCGGTHLRSTGEIGGATLSPPEPLGDGGSRVTLTLTDGLAPPTPPS